MTTVSHRFFKMLIFFTVTGLLLRAATNEIQEIDTQLYIENISEQLGEFSEPIEGFSSKLLEMVQDALEQSQKAIDADIIAFVGITGVGKTTAVNGFMGKEITWNESAKRMEIKGGPKESEIGQRLGQSKTLYTQIYPSQLPSGTSLAFVDCGGFLDTRQEADVPYEIPVIFSLKQTLENARSVKLAICVDAHTILSDKSVHFTDTLKMVFKGLLKNYKDVPNAITLLLTKPPVFEDERVGSLYTRESAIRNIEKLRDSLEENDQRKAMLNYVLREDGKYIAIYDPLAPETKAYALEAFTEMEGIKNPKEAFAISYSPKVKLQLAKILNEIALKGVNLYQKFFHVIKLIVSLDQNIQPLHKKRDDLQTDIKKIGNGEENPEAIKQKITTLIANQEKEVRTKKEKLDQYGEEKEEIQDEIDQLKAELDLLDKEGNQEVNYWQDSIYEKGIVFPVTEKIETKTEHWFLFFSWTTIDVDYKTGYHKERIVRNFSYSGPKIARVQFDPPYDADVQFDSHYWYSSGSSLSPKNLVGRTSFSIRYQTACGERAEAEVTVFVKKKDLPATHKKREEITEKIMLKCRQIDQLTEEEQRTLKEIGEINKNTIILGNIINQVKDYKKLFLEVYSKIQKMDKEKSEFMSRKKIFIKIISSFKGYFEFLKEYIQIDNEYRELREHSIIQEFLSLDQKFTNHCHDL